MLSLCTPGRLALAAALPLLALAGCVGDKAPGAGRPAAGWVARRDFEVSRDWAPKPVMGRTFWNTLHPGHLAEANRAMMREVADLPMVREAALLSHLGVLTPETSNAIPNDALDRLGVYLNGLRREPLTPHFIKMMAARPPYRVLREIRYDRPAYESWKERHPDFAGFIGGSEWDNEFIRGVLRGEALERLEQVKASEETIENVKRELPRPKDRREALAAMAKCHAAIRHYFFNDPDRLGFIRSGWCFDHYAFEGGADMAWMETTNSGFYRHQVSFFFTRGAARQYRKHWGWFIALYYNGYDEQGNRLSNCRPSFFQAGETIGPDHGQSPTLYERSLYLAYLAGASFVYHEGWYQALCRPKPGRTNLVELSPYGRAKKDWYDFTQRTPRGISYAPVALLVPFDQGYPQWGGSPWGVFRAERADLMIDAFLYTIVPHSRDVKNGLEGCLSNSRYGDLYDVILPGTPRGPVSREVLGDYKVAILLGDHGGDKALADRLREYVKAGGTLVLNIQQANEHFSASFLGFERARAPGAAAITVQGEARSPADGVAIQLPEPYDCERIRLKGAAPLLEDAAGNVLACLNAYGKGRVLVTTVDYLIPREGITSAAGRSFPLVEFLMDRIVREVLPLEVKGDVEYGLNKLDDGWLLYLINNRGVTKYANTAQRLDPSKIARVEVLLKEIRAEGLIEGRSQAAIPHNQADNTFTVDVPPGDIRIIKISE